MADGASTPSPESAPEDEEKVPTFREAFAAAARKSGLGQVTPGEAPTRGALLKAVGGVRGIIESILPLLGFTLVYTITKNVGLAVAVPVGVSVIFVLIRLVTRSPVSSALIGLVIVGISAGIALLTGQGKDNFVLGFILNGVFITFLGLSLIAKRPLIGLIAGFLTGMPDWLKDPARFRASVLATCIWIGVFGGRLAVELPLYFADLTEGLGVAKLVMGVPLYALALWGTWALMRTAYGRPQQQ